MRNKIGMLGLMGAMMLSASGMDFKPRVLDRPRFRQKPNNSEPLPQSIINPVIPKGHKVTIEVFRFATQTYGARIELRISGGTPKSLNKKRILIGNILQEYIKMTPRESLLEFAQFEVYEIKTTDEK